MCLYCRNHSISIRFLRSSCARSNLEIGSDISEVSEILTPPQALSVTCPSLRYYHGTRTTPVLSLRWRSLSTQAGAKNSGEEDESEDAFSELEQPVSNAAVEGTIAGEDDGDGSISESELSDNDDIQKASHDELELSEHEADSIEKKQSRKVASKLFKAIIAAQGVSVQQIMDKWVEEGKELDKDEISMAMLNLRKRKMYVRALQVSFL